MPFWQCRQGVFASPSIVQSLAPVVFLMFGFVYFLGSLACFSAGAVDVGAAVLSLFGLLWGHSLALVLFCPGLILSVTFDLAVCLSFVNLIGLQAKTFESG